MRAVIFAVMVAAAASSWLAYDERPRYPEGAALDVQPRGLSASARYRADATACSRQEGTTTRRSCERAARQRLLTGIRQDAGLVSFR
jgi:hypothetical protein